MKLTNVRAEWEQAAGNDWKCIEEDGPSYTLSRKEVMREVRGEVPTEV